jgi:hypothetical protein
VGRVIVEPGQAEADELIRYRKSESGKICCGREVPPFGNGLPIGRTQSSPDDAVGKARRRFRSARCHVVHQRRIVRGKLDRETSGVFVVFGVCLKADELDSVSDLAAEEERVSGEAGGLRRRDEAVANDVGNASRRYCELTSRRSHGAVLSKRKLGYRSNCSSCCAASWKPATHMRSIRSRQREAQASC